MNPASSRQTLKRPLESSSGDTPAPKRHQTAEKPVPEPESEGEEPKSPTPAPKKKKARQSLKTPKTSAPKPAPRPPIPRFSNTPQPAEPPQDRASPLPEAFTPAPSEPPPDAQPESPNEDSQSHNPDNIEFGDAIAILEEDWAPDPTAEKKNLSRLFGPIQCSVIQAPPPTQEQVKSKWDIVLLNHDRPELNHVSDNPYDFLPIEKIENLIRFWQDDKEAEQKLSDLDKRVLGNPGIRKILAKVVTAGPQPIEEDKRFAWIQAAIASVVSQRDPSTDIFKKSSIAIDPAKPGYTWIIVPVGVDAFKAIEGVRAALDPRSGTLVLFRVWDDAPFPPQRLYATGIHYTSDPFPADKAIAEYKEQMAKPLEDNNIKILAMTPTVYGMTSNYCIKMKLGFTEGTPSFLINPQFLPKTLWTGPSHRKRTRIISYKWPPKCRYCESEAHSTPKCPWQDITPGERKPNFNNCRYHFPGWTETVRREKSTVIQAQAIIKDFRPVHGRTTRGNETAGKGDRRNMDTVPMDNE